MKRQDIFNAVREHLLAQNARSETPRDCLYRGPHGLKCAIGVLIKDEFFDESWNSMFFASKEAKRAVELSLERPLDEEDMELLEDLQNTHDNWCVSAWKDQLDIVAERHGLEVGV